MKKVGYFFYSFLPVLVALGLEFLASFFIMGVAFFFLAGKGTMNIQDLTGLASDVNFNGALSVIFSTLTVALFGLWYYYRFEGDYLPKPSQTFHPFLFIGITLLVPISQIGSGMIASLMGAIHPAWMEYYEKLMENAGMDGNIGPLMLFYSVVMAPIGEELIFRGVTMRAARRALPFWLANLMQAFLFGCFHMNFIQGAYAFAIGLILGFICEKCGSIYYSIFFHIVFNFWGTVLGTFINSLTDGSPNAMLYTVCLYGAIIVAAIAGIIFLYQGLRWKKTKAPATQPHLVLEETTAP